MKCEFCKKKRTPIYLVVVDDKENYRVCMPCNFRVTIAVQKIQFEVERERKGGEL
jgi:hypothetical protein